MPLFNYQCQDCDWLVERFLHNRDEEVELVCDECEGINMERVMGLIHNRTQYNAHDTLHNKILPDVDRIQKKVSSGSDSDFLDITGN